MFAYFFVNYINGYSLTGLVKEGSGIYIVATTMTLAGIVFSQIGAVMNCRTENQSGFKKGIRKNRKPALLIGHRVRELKSIGEI